MATYREATRSDLRAICVLGQEVNAIHHDAWPEIFAPSGDPARDEDQWLKTIDQADATTFVAEDGGAIVGFVNISFIEKESHPLLQPLPVAKVGSVGVTSAHRGQGIGRELMRLAESWARAKGARHVLLNVWTFNKRGAKLYKELGYEVRSSAMGKRLAQ